jgi:ABC-type antimicrobial peptide transport system permease subunit
MGLKDPIGVTITDANQEWQVVGVVKDFIFTSPTKKAEPIILFGAKAHWALGIAYIRLNPRKPVSEHLEVLKDAWKKVNPDVPFEYKFADVDYMSKFLPIQRTLKIATTFSLIAITIACLGLLGLSMFMVENRIREIGIRKAMGGTSFSIIKLLGFTSIKPVLIAVVIFSPLALWAMRSWLENFDYRIELNIGMVVIAGIIVIVISVLTSLTQTWKATMVNPAKTLRHE